MMNAKYIKSLFEADAFDVEDIIHGKRSSTDNVR